MAAGDLEIRIGGAFHFLGSGRPCGDPDRRRRGILAKAAELMAWDGPQSH
ncbi:hypothetical protein [uncultured Mycobacterium sp.]